MLFLTGKLPLIPFPLLIKPAPWESSITQDNSWVNEFRKLTSFISAVSGLTESKNSVDALLACCFHSAKLPKLLFSTQIAGCVWGAQVWSCSLNNSATALPAKKPDEKQTVASSPVIAESFASNSSNKPSREFDIRDDGKSNPY